MPFSSAKIVIPIDFSGESRAAIKAGINIGGDASRLHLVHVILPLDSVTVGRFLKRVNSKQRLASIEEKLAKLTQECGATEATTVILHGTPGLEIADYAKTQGADLIVMPSHGYHGIKRLVLGSVAERVIRHAECSVLILRRSDAQ